MLASALLPTGSNAPVDQKAMRLPSPLMDGCPLTAPTVTACVVQVAVNVEEDWAEEDWGAKKPVDRSVALGCRSTCSNCGWTVGRVGCAAATSTPVAGAPVAGAPVTGAPAAGLDNAA